MAHKTIPNSDIANNINKIASPISGHTFLGLLEISDTNSWGIIIEQRNYCGAYLMVKTCKVPLSNEVTKEEKFIEKEQSSIVLLRGPGNKSFIKRFKNKAEATAWYHKALITDSDQDGSMLEVDENIENKKE